MPEKDAPIRNAIMFVLGTSRRGRKKVIAKLRKTNPNWSSFRIRRVYEQSGFALHRRLKKRVQHPPAAPLELPLAPNVEWAMDFMADSLVNGRMIRTLNIIDQYNRKILTIHVDTSITARKLTRILDQVIERHGKPLSIRTDNGSEFTSKWFQLWLQKQGIEWKRIPNGRPDKNAFIERFNRTYRDEVLDVHVFFTIADAQRRTDAFIEEYNNDRPHESLNDETPNSYAA